MRLHVTTLAKSFALTILLLAALTASQSVARADEVVIGGYTNGCFNCVNPSNPPGYHDATLLGLHYNNSAFLGRTANGFRGLGGNPVDMAQNFNNLGAFHLHPSQNVYDGNTFRLRVTFTLPEGINGANSATFSATIVGTVRSSNDGGVFIDFNNTPILFTFSDVNCESDPFGAIPGQQTTCGNGSFLFAVNDLSISPGQTAEITGQITSAQQTPIPEPATLLLLGTGLTGLAGAARRRMKRGKNS